VALRSILIIADDLTGAADSAVQFRHAGFSAVVLAQLASPRTPWPRAQVVSLSLNSRDASPAAVRRIWERQAPAIRALAHDALVYHKIDSTLRGHPALEVRLLLDCLGAASAIVAPAFPKLGRQTVDGVHRVDGMPLAETEYSCTRRRSQATSHLLKLLAAGEDARAVHLPWQVIDAGVEIVAQWLRERIDASCRLITADAAHERHLDILSQALLPLAGRVLLVGSAGWAERLAIACQGLLAGMPAGPGALGIVGSLSAAATRQVNAASQAGVTVVRWASPSAAAMPGETVHDWQSIVRTLAAGRSVVVWTNPGAARPPAHTAGQRVLRTVADKVRELLSITPVGGLMIVGGDTAHTVFRALRARGLVLAGEVAPGVPYGRLMNGPFAGLLTATKAGGFGTDTVLAECLTFLRQGSAQ
jgi:D-threonate/D-erythronate kinase